MSYPQKNIDLERVKRSMLAWLKSRLEEENYHWISSKSDQLNKGGEDWEFYSAFSSVPRYTGKAALKLSAEEKQEAEKLRSGWKPGFWSIDELGRMFLVLSIAKREKEDFLDKLEKTFVSSDMGEAVALYKGLPILPYPEALQDRAAEGIRSNMTSVFNAVALRNPYPAEYLDEAAWNQLVLKALFVESPLYLIQGIDKRANRTLAEMLVDYAHERWAADRSVSPELWRPVGPFAEGEMIDDLQKVLHHSDDIQKYAAMLALASSPSEKAQALISGLADKSLQDKIDSENITWNDIGRLYNK